MPELNLVNIFDRRARLGFAEELKIPDTFMITTFMNAIKEFAVETIDLDVRIKRRKMSAYVFRHQEGNLVQASGYATKTFKTPALKPKIIITPSDVAKRLPAGDIYDDSVDLSSTIADLIAEQIVDLNDEQIVRNEEWQVKQAIVDGKIEALNEKKEVILTIDFQRDSSLQAALTGTDKWDDSSSDIPKTIRKRRQLIKKISGFTARMALLGAEAADEFLKNAAIQKQLDSRVADRGQLKFDLQDDGAIYLGRLDGVDFWTYEEYIIDPSDDVEKFIIPPKKCLLAAPQATATRTYGSVEADVDGQMVIAATARLVNIYSSPSKDPVGTVIQVHSSPAMITNHPNAYAAFDTF